MTGVRVELTAFDVPDLDVATEFWCDLTGWRVVRQVPDWVTIEAGDGQQIALQLAPDHVPPVWPGQDWPQQVHLDLYVADEFHAAEQAVALGAERLRDADGFVVLADPAGHPFCLARDAGQPAGVTTLANTVFDCPDAGALAAFYAGLLDLQVIVDEPDWVKIEGDGHRLAFQRVDDYAPPRWPDPAFPQQGHLDLLVDDRDAVGAVEQRAFDLGATRLPGAGDGFYVYADPAGHPFCLTFPF
ncbi:VOC family protein [Spongisporangium articulatum]|uniref:VOC family protein n=1 Tax=Spongisporangium articulatum TaxID=3362603 RepID=A0ABW8AJY9_9ACTN